MRKSRLGLLSAFAIGTLTAILANGSTLSSVATSAGGFPGAACSGATTCTTSANQPDFSAFGSMTANAALVSPSMLVYANVAGSAVCNNPLNCITFIGNADAELDLTIDGLTGTPAIAVFHLIQFGQGFGSKSVNFTGVSENPTFFGAVDIGYDFIFGQPFHISAMASAGCSECDANFTAGVTNVVKIYDTNLRLLGTITAPSDWQGTLYLTPEPSAFALGLIGFVALVFLKKRREFENQISRNDCSE